MDLITVTTIFLTSLNMQYSNDYKFAYNVEMANDAVVSKVVYKKINDGKHLSHHLKYNYTYDEQERLVKKEVLKWNSIYEKWEHSHCLNYVYNMSGFSLEYALWNNKESDYTKTIAKQIYNDMMNGAVNITLYKWNKLDNDWVVQSDMVAINPAANLLVSFELDM